MWPFKKKEKPLVVLYVDGMNDKQMDEAEKLFKEFGFRYLIMPKSWNLEYVG